MTESRKCQSCGHAAVASCTGKTDYMFGVRWPGGKEQKGYVPPHELLGLREEGAAKNYMNFSWCLVCGQIQGEWPTKAGLSHLIKHAEKRYWEVIICTTNTFRSDLDSEAMHGWYSMFFHAVTKQEVELYMEAQPPEHSVHCFVHEVCGETTIPDDANIMEI